MQPISHRYPQAQLNRLLAAITPMQRPIRSRTSEMHIARGQPIFKNHDAEVQSYLVTSGEVAILRNGRPIDLIECGEVLDLLLWPSTTAMALSDCTLATITPSALPQLV